jgi:hypothetical protein
MNLAGADSADAGAFFIGCGRWMVLPASPAGFGFAGLIRAPYVVLGLFEMAASLLTMTYAGMLSGPRKAST